MRTTEGVGFGSSRKLVWLFKWAALVGRLSILLLFTGFGSADVLADGCFVFKWNKDVDIKEPTQKAIVCFDAGREELLLQVKYEGPLEEFGWLIPVPSLPKVEQGSMEPFYELSQLTQRRFTPSVYGGTRGMRTGGTAGAEPVQVIEIKTVGAYEVSILSAHDSESLTHWLQDHDYSVPEGKSEIVDEYLRRGWYFIAARIDLHQGLAFKTVGVRAGPDAAKVTKARSDLQKKLSSGELHPLLITFESSKGVLPLKISAVNGAPSEVSVYIISRNPLLERSLFKRSAENLREQYARWEEQKPERAKQLEQLSENSRTMGLRFFLDSFYKTNVAQMIPAGLRDYTEQDLQTLAREGQRPRPTERLDDRFYARPGEEPLQCMSLAAFKIPACSRIFKRLNAGEWYVTKHVQTFASAEMHDLEFELALPALAGLLPEPGGSAAAQLLSELGPEAHAFLFRSCGSTNGTERLNAVSTLRSSRPPAYGDLIPRLLKDDNPAVRLIVLQAIENGSDDRFVESALELLRDPHIEIRSAATGYLMGHERPERTPFYLALMEDHDPNVRMHAIGIATWINRYSPSDAVFFEALRRLKDPDENVQASALQALHQMNPRIPVAREHLLPFLTSSFADVNSLALGMLRLPMRSGNQPTYDLSSFEAAALITNRLTMARLQGLKVLQQNADATAVELMLPLLADNNKLVRNRAFCVLRSITGDDASENDPSKWRAWWEANKSSFKSRKPGQ